MTFDLNSIVPEGYEVVGVDFVQPDASYLIPHSTGFIVGTWGLPTPSRDKHIIVKKIHTFKEGDAVLVRDSYTENWRARVFAGYNDKSETYQYCVYADIIDDTYCWKYCIPFTTNPPE